MNWTGGRLQQHKNKGGNTAANRQKQHFASVRQMLQNGGSSPRKALFRPSFLTRDVPDPANTAINPFGLSLQHRLEHSKVRQRKLDEFRSTAPLAYRLASMKDRSSACTSSTRIKHSIHDELKREHPERTQRPSSMFNHQISRSLKRHVLSPASSSSSNHKKHKIQESVEEDTLEIGRRKLLEQSDWVGLAPSRPLHMKFSSLHDKAKIGKRRRMDCNIRERRAVFRGEKFETKNSNGRSPHHRQLVSGPHGRFPGSISVRIGDDALTSQMSVMPAALMKARVVPTIRQQRSSITPIDTRKPQVAAHLDPMHGEALFDLQRSSSDTMLFDVENQGESYYLQDGPHPELIGSQHYHDVSEQFNHVPHEAQQGTVANGSTYHSLNLTDSSQHERPDDGHARAEEDNTDVNEFLNRVQPSHPYFLHELQAVEAASRDSSASHFYPSAHRPFRLILDSTSPTENLKDQPVFTAPAASAYKPLQTEHILPRPDQSQLPNNITREGHGHTSGDQSSMKAKSAWMKFLSLSTSLFASDAAQCDAELNRTMHSEPNERSRDTSHEPNTTIQPRDRVNPHLRNEETECSLASLPIMVTSTVTTLPTQAPILGESKEELWRKFVFADGDDESSSSKPPEEDGIDQSRLKAIARLPASSLFMGISISPPGIDTNRSPTNVTMESYRHAVSRCESIPKTSTNRGDWSDHDLMEASLENNPVTSDAPPHFEPEADPESWRETTSLAHASMLQNLPRSSSLLSDATAAADGSQPSGESNSIRCMLFANPKPFVGEASAARRHGPSRIGAHAKGVRRGRSLTKQKEASPHSIYDFPVDLHDMLESLDD